MEQIDPNANITRTFWRFTIPAIAAMMVNGLYQLVDGVFVGHFIGSDGLAAINIAWPVIAVVAGLGLMIGMGAGSIISIYRGEGNITKARGALSTGVGLIAVLGVFASLFLVLCGQYLVSIQGAFGQIENYANDYLLVLTYGASITVASGAIPFLIRNDDSPNVATLLMVTGALVNIVLDYLFIGHMGMGLFGAALATLIAQATSVIIGLVYFFSPFSKLGLLKQRPVFNLSDAGRSLVLGSSSLVMYMYYGVVVAVHNRLFAEYGSPLAVAAFAIVGYLMTLYYVVAEGIAEGMQPQVSFYKGSRAFNNIGKVVGLACKVSLVAGLLWLLLLNVFPDWIIGWFNNGNQQLMEETTRGIRLHLIAMYLDGLIIITAMYFLSVGKGGLSISISLGNMFIQIPFLIVMPKVFGVTGVWLAMPASNVLLAAIVLPLIWRDIKQASGSQTQAPELSPSVA